MKKLLSLLMAIALGVSAVADNSRVTAVSYVQRNLIAHWDGINNQGKDASGDLLAHDASAATWVDLVGGRVFTFTGTVNWQNGKAFKFNGSTRGFLDGTSTSATFGKITSSGTYECAATMGGASQTLLKTTAAMAHFVGSGGNYGYCFRNASTATRKYGSNTETKTFAVVYSGSSAGSFTAYGNAAKLSNGSSDNVGGNAMGGTIIGGRSKSNSSFSGEKMFKGDIKAIRLYQRQLSLEEININYAIDRVRFYGVTADIDTIMPAGWGIGDDSLICHLYKGEFSLTPTVSYSDYSVKFADGASATLTALPAAGASAMAVTGKSVAVKGALTFTLPEGDLRSGIYSLVKADSITLAEGATITVVDPLQQCICTPVVTETEISVKLALAPVRATWIGGTDGAVDDPACWTCWDKNGDVLEGRLPTDETIVTLPDGCSKHFPVSAGFPAREVVLPVTLGITCDWRGLEGETLSSSGSIDLQGHDLYVTLGSTPMNYATFSNSSEAMSTVHISVPEGVLVSLNAWTFGENVRWFNDGPGEVVEQLPPVYAKFEDGVFSYFDTNMVSVAAPKDGMTNTIMILFSDNAEYQALLSGAAEEVARAKMFALENDIVLTANTDWSAQAFDLNGHVISLSGCNLKVSSLLGEGYVTSCGSVIANGNFSADTIPSGSTRVTLSPKGWKASANGMLLKNDESYAGHQMNGALWYRIPRGQNISQTFTVAKAGTYRLLYKTAASNPKSGTTSYATLEARIDGTSVQTNSKMGWTSTEGNNIDKNISVGVGTHTFSLVTTTANNGNAIVKNVELRPTANYVNKTSVLEVCVPEGVTTTNSTVSLAGGTSLRVEKTGAGTLVMAKENGGFGAANAIAGWESIIVKAGKVEKTETSVATLGTQYALVKVEAGAQLELGGRSYWDYDYMLAGAGSDGTGALINTTSVSEPWTASNSGYLRHITLTDDATIGGCEGWGMLFYNAGANTATLNGHTLTYKLPGRVVWGGFLSYSGEGRIVVDEGTTLAFESKTPTAGDAALEVRGILCQEGASLTPVKSLVFTETGSFAGLGATAPIVVRTLYAPNVNTESSSYEAHPAVQLGTAEDRETTLDLSRFSDVFGGTNLTFFANTFATVDVGSRVLVAGQKLVGWSAIPENVQFIFSGDNITDYRLVARADGLYVEEGPTFATINPVTGDWSFFGADGRPYRGVWEQGVTPEIEVRFASEAEFEAIGAAHVTPRCYVLTGLSLREAADLTGGIPFMVAKHATLDIRGQSLKMPSALLMESLDLTITDSIGSADNTQGGLHIEVPQGETMTMEATFATLTGALKLVKEGEGTLVANRAQTYTGGNDVKAGTFRWGNAYPGPIGTPVTVYEGAVFDLGGHDSANARPVLAGGTLVNTVKDVGNGLAQNAVVTVTANSAVDLTYSAGLIGSSYAATTLDLGGKELAVNVASGKSFWLYNAAVSAGTLKFSGEGTLAIDKTSLRAPEANFDLGGEVKATVAVPSEVYGWIVGETATVSGAGVITINGTYKPIGDSVSTYVLKSGATLDLSGRGDILDLTEKNVTFATDATIFVRAPLQKSGLVVAWQEPDNFSTLTFVKAPGEKGTLTASPVGLVYLRGLTLIFR